MLHGPLHSRECNRGELRSRLIRCLGSQVGDAARVAAGRQVYRVARVCAANSDL